MKLLLVKPPLNRNLLAPNHDEPLELEYLAAAAGHEVQILDMRLDKNLDRALSRFKPSLVGITAYTCDHNSTLSVLREVKKFDADIRTAMGGHHATMLPADEPGMYDELSVLNKKVSSGRTWRRWIASPLSTFSPHTHLPDRAHRKDGKCEPDPKLAMAARIRLSRVAGPGSAFSFQPGARRSSKRAWAIPLR